METRNRRWKRLRLALVAVAAISSVAVFAVPVQAADDYPYAGDDPSELDERGFYYRHCTSFVAWRMSQRGEFHNHMQGGHWWHARNWAANAQQLGFAVDAMPAPGAIAHWYAGEQGADELGHVAVVESVHADGSVTVEEYNGTNPLGYSRRGPTQAPRYIHVYDSPVPAPIDMVPTVSTRSSMAAPAAQRTPPSVAPVTAAVDRAPTGHLTEPTRRLVVGEVVTVAGRLSDDSRIEKVRFFATDNKRGWIAIGTDAHGGDGEYAVRWRVSFPAGSRISFTAEAIDDAGTDLVETIRGLEDIGVDGPVVSKADVAGHRRSVSLESERNLSASGDMGIIPLLPPIAVFFLSGVSGRRIAKRTTSEPKQVQRRGTRSSSRRDGSSLGRARAS